MKIKNPRHEAFCQAYAGPAWGNAAEAYRRAGYRAKNPQVAANSGLKLLGIAGISERVKFLRSNLEEALRVDRMELAQIRLEIARDKGKKPAERLDACRDIEKAMGWAEPDQLNVAHSGALEHRWTVPNIKDGNGTAQGQ